jgi:hypothetical protein
MRQFAGRTIRGPVAGVVLAGGMAALIVTLTAADAPGAKVDAKGMHVGAVALRSAGVMSFGSDGTLFLADPLGAAVYAIDVADPLRDTTRTGVRIDDVDGKIAAALGTTRDQLRVIDMVAHPASQALYFSLTRGRGTDAVPLVVRVTKVDEKVTVIPLESIRHSKVDLGDAPNADAKTPWGAPQRTYSITDLALVDNELYVAGLSNEEFASTLRRMPYPFVPGKSAKTTVEMYHTSHDRYETAAPIESFLPITVGGKPWLLAGYGCSPIVTFNRADIASNRHLRGKTVSELGGGNRPIDMITYRAPDGKQRVLIANSTRTLTRFDAEALANGPAMTTSMKQAYEAGGVSYLSVASFGVLQLDNYNAANVVVLQRNPDDGTLQVMSRQLQWV